MIISKARVVLMNFQSPNQGNLILIYPRLRMIYGVSLERRYSKEPEIYKVGCRMAGYRGPATSLYPGKYREIFKYHYIIRIQTCLGTEKSLLNCTYQGPLQRQNTEVAQLNCGYPSDKVQLIGLKNQSSTSNDNSSQQNILNEDDDSCFMTKRETDPWLEVRIDSSKYIHTLSLVLTNSSKSLPVEVLVYRDTASHPIKCTVKVKGRERTVKCNMLFKADTIKIQAKGKNVQLGLCRIDVFAISSLKMAQGTYLDAWSEEPKYDKGSIIKFDSTINNKDPAVLQFLPAFDLQRTFRHYISEATIKQAAYIYMVPIDGIYSFGVVCKVDCEVWFKRVHEPGLSDPGTEDKLIIKYGASVFDNKYQVSTEQNKRVHLSVCHVYHLDLYTNIGRSPLNNGFTNMAVKFPGGKGNNWSVASSSVKKLFFWTKPGWRYLHFSITNDVAYQVNIGSHFLIKATYKFCCRGLDKGCPSCPLNLKMQLFDKTIVVNGSLQMDCQVYNMTYVTVVDVQAANYSLQISYSFVGEVSDWEQKRTIISNLHVKRFQHSGKKGYNSSTGDFTCFDNTPIPYTMLCDGIHQCRGGEDERSCGSSCRGFKCFDGSCITSSCNSRVCDDNSHLFSNCKYCGSGDVNICGEQNNSKCRTVPKGICGFNNGPCGLHSTSNSTHQWAVHTPNGKDDYPSYDHSMKDQGSFFLLEPVVNNTGYSKVAMNWTNAVPYCLQFWYIIPNNSDSSIQVLLDNAKAQIILWSKIKGDSNEWSFGQVEIPGQTFGNPYGKIMIIGFVNTSYVALDDLNFIEDTGCDTIKSQDSPNCYFDGSKQCSISIDGLWRLQLDKLKTKYKQEYQQDWLLELPQFLWSNDAHFTSGVIHPKSHGWKCLRFWLYSGEAHFSRKVEVYFVTNGTSNGTFYNTSRLVLSYSATSNDWRFIQLPVPQNEDNLKVMVQSSKDKYAVLSVDEITFSKVQCQNIPVLPDEECRKYKELKTPERRYDRQASDSLSDEVLSTEDWYRVKDAAGNQIHQKCVQRRFGCSGYYKAWINASMPNVAEGRVKRKLCISYFTDCCYESTEITVRNCTGFYVYKFPTYSNYWHRAMYCSSYNHKLEVKKLNAATEWENWESNSINSEWRVLSKSQIQEIIRKIGNPLADKKETSDAEFLLNGSASFTVQPKQLLKFFTTCLWLSFTNNSKMKLAIDIQNSGASSPVITLTKNSGSSTWRHLCLTWKSAFGVTQFYADGVALNDKGVTLHDMVTLDDPQMTFNFTSSNISILRLNNLDLWDKVLLDEEILYMSYRCTSQNGSLLNWREVQKAITTNPLGEVSRFLSTSCIGKEGDVLTLFTNGTTPTSTKRAIFISPRYERSSKSSEKCLRFRYRLWAPGASVLKIYQLLEGFPKRPLWMDNVSNTSAWRDGQVTVSGLSDYKIIIEGGTKDVSALISIGALYTTDGICTIIPPKARQACNEILSANTGYVISPYYPGYYSNNAICTWSIRAQENRVIRIDFQEFVLEQSPRCTNDYVEVYNGQSRLSSMLIGRYCGNRYPPIIQSTSNNLLVVFKTNGNITRSGFMARYRFIEEQNNSCVQDCPQDCVCERLQNKGIVVSSSSSGYLRAIPRPLPKDSIAILFHGNQILQVQNMTFYKLQRLEYIDLSFNKILTIKKNALVNLPSLEVLRLNMNYIRIIDGGLWDETRLLHSLDIGQNLISSISRNAFSNLPNLTILSIRSNLIENLDVEIFESNHNLTYLYLHDNYIGGTIPDGLFRNQKHLKILTLHANKLSTFSKLTFTGLKQLENLTLHNNFIRESTISQDTFDNFVNLKYLSLDSFMLCCYATKSIPGLTCKSNANAFSSCEDMLKQTIIRTVIWVQAVLATFGNITAIIIWWKLNTVKRGKKTRGKADVQSFLLINLALADFLMGIYLMIIAIQDVIFKGSYFKYDVYWRSGIMCQIAGGISMLSSEVSVMMLVTMTADRFNTIIFDFRSKRLGLRGARALCMLVWIVGVIVAVLPVFHPGYLSDEKSGFTFFGRSTVCLPFQLSSELTAGWEYSVGIFFGFNGAAFLFIFIAYSMIFIKVQKSANRVRNSRSNSSSLGRRVVFIVLTDFCCWMPVMVLGILSLTGIYIDNTGSVYAWIAVFVLPINSSINPILYTFSTPEILRKLKSRRRPSVGQARQVNPNGTENRREVRSREYPKTTSFGRESDIHLERLGGSCN